MRFVLKILAVGSILFFAIGSANASCGRWGKIVYSVSSTASTTYYMAPHTVLPNYYFTFNTNNANLMNHLDSAQNEDEATYVLADGNCPAAVAAGGTYFIGNALRVNVSSNY